MTAHFRILYTDANRCSAMRVLKPLQGSPYGRSTPEGRKAIEALKEVRTQAQLEGDRRLDDDMLRTASVTSYERG